MDKDKFIDEILSIASDGKDIDGGTMQEIAEKHGLIERVTIHKSCGEYCACAEFLGFPCECYRRIDGLNTCKKCSDNMIQSQAIEQTYTGTPDFIGGDVCTVSPGGTGKLVDCLKCEDCGWSVYK